MTNIEIYSHSEPTKALKKAGWSFAQQRTENPELSDFDRSMGREAMTKNPETAIAFDKAGWSFSEQHLFAAKHSLMYGEYGAMADNFEAAIALNEAGWQLKEQANYLSATGEENESYKHDSRQQTYINIAKNYEAVIASTPKDTSFVEYIRVILDNKNIPTNKCQEITGDMRIYNEFAQNSGYDQIKL